MHPDQPPPPPSAWTGTPAQYYAAVNNAGFTWNPDRQWWDWGPAATPAVLQPRLRA